MARTSQDPLVWKASAWPWQYFGSLTWGNDLVNASEIRKMKILFAYYRYIAKRLPVAGKSGQILSNRKSFWALETLSRGELGEITGRHHFHYLLAGLHDSCLGLNTTFLLKNSWERFGGHARVYRYDAALSGAEYVLKPEPSSYSVSEAYSYEVAKFDGSDSGCRELMLAQSLQRKWVMAQSDKRARKALAATVRGSRSKDRAGTNTEGIGLVSSFSLVSASR